MLGQGGSGDALGTWILIMLLGAGGGLVPGILAYTGRWRRWYQPIDSPIRYAPLVAIPFGVGCLIELVATVAPLSNPLRQGVVVALLVCLLLSGTLFLSFPAWLRPGWMRELDAGTKLPS
jgi:hypothetical protein